MGSAEHEGQSPDSSTTPDPSTNVQEGQGVLRAAVKRLSEDQNVQAVYAFGSIVHGGWGAQSDVDLAVLLDRSIDLRQELRLRATVTQTLARDDVDLVILNNAPPLLRFEVAANGHRLFTRDEAFADGFERRSSMTYFDTARLRETQRKLAKEALER